MRKIMTLAHAAAASTALSRPTRGLVAVRNDVSDPNKVIEALNKAFHDFKVENDARLKGIDKKFDDVVQAEKVEKISAEVSKFQAAIDEVNALVAASKLSLGGGENLSPEKKAHATAFDAFFRKGVENGLKDLEVKASLSSSSNPEGGFTVPTEHEKSIDRVLGTVSAMRGIARVVSIGSNEYKKLVNLGGAAAGWVGEKSARPETGTPTLSELAFPAMELYANPAATQGLLDDSTVDIGQWLADEVAITFADKEGAAFVSGSGVNQPRGFLSYDTVANASYAWGKLGYVATAVAADINDASNNGADAILDLIYSIKQGYRTNSRFMMNRTLQGKVRKLKSTGDDKDYLWQPSIQLGQPATLAGYPITDDDNMPDVGANAFPIAFGDFQRGYLIVDRVGIRVLRDPFTNKPYVHFYTTKRVGGGVQNFEAIKLLKCAAS